MAPKGPVWIVIHGAGGSFLETVDRVLAGFEIACLRQGNDLLVPQPEATAFRHLMQAGDDNPHLCAVRMLLAARALAAPAPSSSSPAPTPETHAALSREAVEHAFAAFGLPVTPAARLRRADQLAAEAASALGPLRAVLREARPTLAGADGVAVTEAQAREDLAARMQAAGIEPDAGIGFLEQLRDMHETGGDLDTVASAVLHAYAEIAAARAAGLDLRYGRDYRFIFVNYHQRFPFTAADGPADILAADLPIEAFPALPDDARRLAAGGIRVRRFEDHHPYTPAAREALEALRRDGILDVLDLSGPLKGEDLPPGAERCAADMVFDNRIAERPWESAAARRLKALAHAEDFVTDRQPESEALTTLIKGGACKIELAQRLLDGLLADDLPAAFAAGGWLDQAAAMRAALEPLTASLEDNTAVLAIAGPDDPTPRRLLVALAPSPTPDGPRIPVGRAVEYYATTRPDLDYVFYCWGASLMVARRIDQDDTLLNLGELMGRLGTASDGGHGGAAVCRPALNPHYPTALLGRVTAATFQPFIRYLAARLEAEGYTVRRESLTRQVAADRMTRAGRKLAAVLVIALLLGWSLVAFAPAFRRDAIAAGNADFMDYLDNDEAGAQARPDEEPP